MKCPICSTEAAAGTKFCPQCGAKMPGDDAADKAAPTAPVAAATANPTAGMGRRRGVQDVPEETLWEGGYSPKDMVGTFVLVGLIGVGAIVGGFWFQNWMIPLAIIAVAWLAALWTFAQRRLGVRYKMTNQMFYHQKGILTRTTDRIEAIDIDDVMWKQGLVERMFNVGTVEILSRDRTTPKFWLYGIENVEQVAQLIDKARRAERLRRGFLSIQEQNIEPGA